MSFVTVMVMLLQGASPAATPVQIAEPDTRKMSVSEVKAFNATIDPSHPFYIRCRPVQVTGSLVKRGYVCRTRATWDRIAANGNKQARDLVENGTTRPSGQ